MNNAGKFVLVLKHPVPSLNRLFAMHPFERLKEKKQTQRAFLSALEASGADLLTRTTFVQNTWLIASDMRKLSQTTAQNIFDSASNKSSALKEKNEL